MHKTDFERVLKQRRLQVTAPPFLLLACPGQAVRLGIVVGKRFVARAVDRNLVKRLLRESFRRWRGELPAVDLVVMLRQRIQGLDRNKLRTQIEALWRGLVEKARLTAN